MCDTIYFWIPCNFFDSLLFLNLVTLHNSQVQNKWKSSLKILKIIRIFIHPWFLSFWELYKLRKSKDGDVRSLRSSLSGQFLKRKHLNASEIGNFKFTELHWCLRWAESRTLVESRINNKQLLFVCLSELATTVCSKWIRARASPGCCGFQRGCMWPCLPFSSPWSTPCSRNPTWTKSSTYRKLGNIAMENSQRYVCLKFSWQNSSKLKCNCRCVANPTNTVLLLTTFLQSKLFQTTFSGDLNTEHLNNGIYENIWITNFHIQWGS